MMPIEAISMRGSVKNAGLPSNKPLNAAQIPQ